MRRTYNTESIDRHQSEATPTIVEGVVSLRGIQRPRWSGFLPVMGCPRAIIIGRDWK